MASKKKLKPRSPSDSHVEINHLVLPSHTNALGTIFGGVMMSWIDVAGAICAQRHSHRVAVTASVDTLRFLAAAVVGDTVTLKARMVHTGRTSMMVLVEVDAEDFAGKNKRRCVTAYLSFVAFDDDKKPTEVPPLLMRNNQEKREFAWAAERREAILKQQKSMGKSKS